MSLDTVTLEDALKLLSLPRLIGNDPADGKPITAHYGRYGPYIKKDTDNRTLESEDLVFTINLEQCVQILAQPKRRRTQAAKPPLRELGADPTTARPMVIKEGRWGPYVTDGETNASLRTGDTVEQITVERAAELLLLRRERGPAPKRRAATKRTATTKRAASTKRRTTTK
jgi:DNA topoisomerase-1